MLQRIRLFILMTLAAGCGSGGGSPATDGDADADSDADADADGDADACASAGEACPGAGDTRCAPEGEARCVAVAGCLVWADPVACDAGSVCAEDACRPCDGQPGDYSDQVLEVDGEERHYFLHVPEGYDCATDWPALVDFHGTAGDFAEEAYGLEALVELSDTRGFLAIRPRSRFSEEGGLRTYRWDQNPGDLPRNRRFTVELVADLQGRYSLDPERLYVSGFSSGTNMAAQFLADEARLFRGVGLVGGGLWNDPGIAPFGDDAPPIYAVTGYRDYMQQFLRQLRGVLDDNAYPADRLFRREVDTGHELYGWHFGEMWDWLDQGQRPQDEALGDGWSREGAVSEDDSLLEVARAADGTLVASGTEGALYQRSLAGDWSLVERFTDDFAPAWSGVCLAPDGTGLAVGEGRVASTLDAGATWSELSAAPELDGLYFGYSYLNGVACAADGRMVAGGYWTGVTTLDAGESWDASSMPAGPGYNAQIAAVGVGPSGTWVAAGFYDYVGRSEDGTTFAPVDLPLAVEWFNGVAAAGPESFWVVGEAGTIVRSTDDGVHWQDVSPGGEDLYGVDFFDAGIGMAVGAHGAAFVTVDGGDTWTPVATGLDGYLGDVVWLDADTAIAVGERGTALRYSRGE